VRGLLAQFFDGTPSSSGSGPEPSFAAARTCAPDGPPVRLLRRREAARYVTETWGIPLSWRTLAKLAVTGGGPLFCKVGRFPLYSPIDLDDWASSKLGSKRRINSDGETIEIGSSTPLC
jgi:hypothetical protein